MTNDQPKQDRSAGLESSATPPGGIEKNEYGKTPLPGSIIVPCKNTECTAAVRSGFVFNTEEWIAGFLSKERECPACKSKAVYSRDDVEVVSSAK
jgi:hypothetical protein